MYACSLRCENLADMDVVFNVIWQYISVDYGLFGIQTHLCTYE